MHRIVKVLKYYLNTFHLYFLRYLLFKYLDYLNT